MVEDRALELLILAVDAELFIADLSGKEEEERGGVILGVRVLSVL